MVLLQQMDALWSAGATALQTFRKAPPIEKQHRRKGGPSLVIVNSQSVKTTAGTSEQTGCDANKKVKGRKRHFATDTRGNVMAAGVTATSLHDKPGSLSLQEQIEDLGNVKKIVARGAYREVYHLSPLRGILNGRW